MADTNNAKFDSNFRAGLLAETDDASRATSPLKVDPTTKRLKVDSNASIVGSTIDDGRKTVSTPATAETLVALSTLCIAVDITAERTNTGTIVVGGSSVVAASATMRGTPLIRGQSMRININDLQKIYLDTTVAGDGVTFSYYL